MRAVRWPVTFISAAIAALALAPAAQAKLSATVAVTPDGSGQRLVVTLASTTPLSARQRPTTVSAAAKGTSYKLTKVPGAPPAGSIGAWRTTKLTGKRANRAKALVGKRVTVTVRRKAGALTLRPKASLPAPASGGSPTAPGGTPAPPTPAPAPTPAPQSLFPMPPTQVTGQAAADALSPYLTDARFTDCPAGWPNCAVEQRYGIFASGDHYYCRLTSTSGADINSYANQLTITGAQQEPSGAWAISYAVLSYGNVHHYRWDVTPTGAATGQWWGTGNSPQTGAPNEIITGMQWVRGALTCAY